MAFVGRRRSQDTGEIFCLQKMKHCVLYFDEVAISLLRWGFPHQFAHGFVFVDFDSQIHRNYYLISVSHCDILYLLSGWVLVDSIIPRKLRPGYPFRTTRSFCVFGSVSATVPFLRFKMYLRIVLIFCRIKNDLHTKCIFANRT